MKTLILILVTLLTLGFFSPSTAEMAFSAASPTVEPTIMLLFGIGLLGMASFLKKFTI